MNSNDFERICNDIYSFSTNQRDTLLELLQSRIWLYEQDDYPEFERIYEFDDSSIKIILGKTDLESLAYALKGASDALKKKIFKNLSKTKLNKLNKKIKELEPGQWSLCEKAIETILETLSTLAASGEIELPAPMVSIPRDFRNAAKNGSLEPAVQAPPLNSTTAPFDIGQGQSIAVHIQRDSRPRLEFSRDGTQSLAFSCDEGILVASIDDATLRKLGQRCAPYAVESNEKPLSVIFDDARRLRANALITLPDDVLKILISEIEVVTWADFLWYFNDSRLTRKVLAFGSPGLTNELLNNLAVRRDNLNPDAESDRYHEKGKQALQAVLAILDRFCI